MLLVLPPDFFVLQNEKGVAGRADTASLTSTLVPSGGRTFVGVDSECSTERCRRNCRDDEDQALTAWAVLVDDAFASPPDLFIGAGSIGEHSTHEFCGTGLLTVNKISSPCDCAREGVVPVHCSGTVQ